MSATVDITHGPGKAALLRSVTNVGEGLTITFETNRGPIEVQIESLDESTNGIEFGLSGHVMSPVLGGMRFSGSYNVEEKVGFMEFGDPKAG